MTPSEKLFTEVMALPPESRLLLAGDLAAVDPHLAELVANTAISELRVRQVQREIAQLEAALIGKPH